MVANWIMTTPTKGKGRLKWAMFIKKTMQRPQKVEACNFNWNIFMSTLMQPLWVPKVQNSYFMECLWWRKFPFSHPLMGRIWCSKVVVHLESEEGDMVGVIRGETWLVFQGDVNLECVKTIIKFRERCWSSMDNDDASKIWCWISWFRACSCTKLMMNVLMNSKSTRRRGIGHAIDNKGGVLWGVRKVDGAQHILAFNEKFVNVSTNETFDFFDNHDTFERSTMWIQRGRMVH